MKCSIAWLREWVDPKISNEDLCEKLTMSGLEVESLEQDGKDFVVDVSITPNRGDCMSVRGLAREVAAITGTGLSSAVIPENAVSQALIRDPLSVSLDAPTACPCYIGRVIRGVKADAATPAYITERLRQSGIRVISPVVDVTNYVMLELGQPMHAFDLATIDSEVRVRFSKKDEKINLLDGTEKTLDAETLVIADKHKPLAVAGVMGGLDSSVTLSTKDILLESAWFKPQTVARTRQLYNLSSESASRFERGVDYTIQREAIERATRLILEICGGEAGQIVEAVSENDLPKPVTIKFPHHLVKDMLGIDCHPSMFLAGIQFPFQALRDQASLTKDATSTTVPIPPYRFDLTIPEDIVEEVARLYGYDKIPMNKIKAGMQTSKSDQPAMIIDVIRQRLVDDGFHEIISYSFVDKKLQKLLDPEITPRELVNPITSEMEVMRTNLWAGLLNTFMHNKSRQQHRVRIFETGLNFIPQHDEIKQEKCLAGLISGLNAPEQWGSTKREVDFYDLKGTVERVLATSLDMKNVQWRPEMHPALHPGQSAGIYYHDQRIGIMGAISPVVIQSLDVKDPGKIFVFELNLPALLTEKSVKASEISKFPEIRRDIALMLNDTVPAQSIQDTIRNVAGDWLKDVFIFDVYQGKGISPGLKSVALGLVLQHPARTLVDDEVNALIERVTTALKGQLGAELRS